MNFDRPTDQKTNFQIYSEIRFVQQGRLDRTVDWIKLVLITSYLLGFDSEDGSLKLTDNKYEINAKYYKIPASCQIVHWRISKTGLVFQLPPA